MNNDITASTTAYHLCGISQAATAQGESEGGFVMGRGYAAVGLDNPKSHENVGAALRACGVYGAAMLATSGTRYSRNKVDTMAAYRHMPFVQIDDLGLRRIIPFDCVPVAVDLIEGATPLPMYQHPERAFYIFGAEDATLGSRVTGWCRDVVYVPTNACMNLAATVNVVLYDRMAKQTEAALARARGES